MKNKDKKQGRRLLFIDYVVMVICISAIIILAIIIKASNDKMTRNQEQLQEVQEQLSKEQTAIGQGGESFAGLVFSEINQEGWIELYNAGDQPMSVSDLTIAIDGTRVLKLEGNLTLETGEMTVCDFEWEQKEQSHLLTMEVGENESAFSMLFPQLSDGQSYGLVKEQEYAVLTATKGKPNTEAQRIVQDEITFSVPGGFYEEAISLQIEAPEGMEIYYTTDGTEPTLDSAKYEKAIEISPRSSTDFVYAASEGIGYAYMCEPTNVNLGTVVRAIAVDQDKNTVYEKSASYFIGLGNNNDMIDMPVISITTNPEGLFDYFDGMYVSGRSYEDALAAGKEELAGNYFNGWERDAYIEYYEPNKDKTYEGNIILKMLDNCNTVSAQKGFEIVSAGDAVNAGSSLYGYFDGKNASVMLQAYLSDNRCRVRELIAEQLLAEEDAALHKLMPCNVFVDGEYWGNYLLKVPYSCNYIFRQEGLWHPTDVVISVNGVVSDDAYQQMYDEMYSFITDNDMSIESNYRKAEELIDMESYIDYVCISMYLANVDFGDLECVWRPVTEHGIEEIDSKWHWMIGNLDNTMGNTSAGDFSTASIDTYYQKNVTENKFLCSLLESRYFRETLQTRMVRFADESFSEEKAVAAIDAVSDKMQKASVSTAKRFLGASSDEFWIPEINEIKKFFKQRSEYILKYTAEIVEDGGIVMRQEHAEEEVQNTNEQLTTENQNIDEEMSGEE